MGRGSSGAGKGVSRYMSQLKKLSTNDSINALIERAANDDSLTNEEYEKIYSAAVDRAREAPQEAAEANRLDAETRERITNGIMTHTEGQNDSAMRQREAYIAREQEIIDNYDRYVRSGYIKSKSDPWWVRHERTLAELKAQQAFFMRERKRLGR